MTARRGPAPLRPILSNPASGLSSGSDDVSCQPVKEKIGLPLILMLVFALTRIPGMMPHNFSAAYAIAFCAGVYFRSPGGWKIPLAVMLATDLALNLYYQFVLHWNVFELRQLVYLSFNYVSFAAIYFIGRRLRPSSGFASLLGGGILGAVLFYLITNTASWFFNPFQNPEYTKTLHGWIQALTGGTAGWPATWEFFRNTLLSGGLFTGLFVAAMKISTAGESAEEKQEPAPAKEESEGTPEEAKA